MRSPALTLAWQLGRRHRRGLSLVLAWLLTLTLLAQALPAGALAPYAHGLATVPFVVAFCYALAVFCYGFEVEMSPPHSGFPARQFTLPVRTGVLVRWPMIYGTVAVALAWVVLAYFVFRRSGLDVPVWGPALAGAALLAWFQAVVWSPFGLPWLRVAVVVGLLNAFGALPLVFREYGPSEPVILMVFAGLIAAAYGVAYAGVASARRGDVPDWWWLPRLVSRVLERRSWRPRSFASPARAQLWLEWRRSGRALPIFVGCWLAFLLPFLPTMEWFESAGAAAGLFPVVAGVSAPASATLKVLGTLLLLPVLLATGFGLGGSGPSSRSPYALSSFAATRPQSTAALVAIKVRTAMRSSLVTWALTVLVVLVWLVPTGKYEALLEFRGRWLADYHPLEVAALSLVILIGLWALTWRQLVNGLWISLTGRAWFNAASMGLGFGLLVALCYLGGWLYRHPEALGTVWALLPWLAGSAVLLKFGVAGWAVRALSRRGLVAARTLAHLAGVWLLAAGGLLALLCWLVPGHVPRHWIACGVILVLPLARVALAPLALAWNRHR
jgi:hypothetical protein